MTLSKNGEKKNQRFGVGEFTISNVDDLNLVIVLKQLLYGWTILPKKPILLAIFYNFWNYN